MVLMVDFPCLAGNFNPQRYCDWQIYKTAPLSHFRGTPFAHFFTKLEKQKHTGNHFKAVGVLTMKEWWSIRDSNS